MRKRSARTALRSAIPRRRAVASTSIRLATLTAPIISRMATAPPSRSNIGAAQFARNRLVQRRERDATLVVGPGILLLRLHGDRVEVGHRVRQRGSRLEATDDVEEMLRPRLQGVRRLGNRAPAIELAKGEREAEAHHATMR